MTFPQTLFGFKGRLRRAAYFGYSLLPLALLVVMVGVGNGLAAAGEQAIGSLLMAVGSITAIWIGCALLVKRLHDFDASGWWALAFYSVSCLHVLAQTKGIHALLSLVLLAVSLLIIFAQGTESPNRFGSQPIKGGLTAVPATI